MNINIFAKEKHLLPIFIMLLRSLSLISKFALTVFIAKFMNFDALGLYGLLMAVTVIAPSLLGFAIMHVYIRDAVTQSRENIVKNLRFYARFISRLYGFLFFVAVIYGLLTHQIALAMIVLAIVCLEHLNNDIYNLMLNLSRQLSGNLLHFIRSGFWMIIFIGSAYYYPSLQTLDTLLIFWIAGSFLSFLGFFFCLKDWPWGMQNKKVSFLERFKKEFSVSRVMYANNVTVSAGQYVNHFLILIFLGLELTGIYVFFMQISSAMSNLLMTGVGQIARPKLVKAYKENDESFNSVYKTCLFQTLFLAVFMSLTAIPVVYSILYYVIDKPLALSWYPVFFLILGLFLLTMVRLVNDMVFYSNFRDDLILKQGLVATLLGLLLGISFIFFFGLWGALIAAILTMLCIVMFQIRCFRDIKIMQLSS